MARKKSNHRKTDVDPIAAERKRLAQRIRKLSRRINQLKTRHNALAPISRLPPEILTRIFFTLQSGFCSKEAAEYYGWTVVTHVCQLWRTVSLETKQLWNVISYTTAMVESPWVAASLERSHPLKLDMVVNFHVFEEYIGFVDKIARQSHRTRALYVNVNGRGWEGSWKLEHLLHSLAVMEAPVLEEFELRGFNQPEILRFFGTNHPRITLFGSLAPCLKSLRVHGLDVTLGALSFTTITTLILQSKPGNHQMVHFNTLFASLRTGIQLDTLTIHHAIFEDIGHGDLYPPTPIPLPSLSSLSLCLPVQQCAKLLSHTTVPHSCRSLVWGWFTHSGHPDQAGNVQTTTYTPQSFFDAILPRFSGDPAEFIALRIGIEEDLIGLRLCKERDIVNGMWGATFSLDIAFISPPGTGTDEGNPTLLPLPSFSRFSKIWLAQMSHPETFSKGLVREITSKLIGLPSLKAVYLPVSLLTTFAKGLYDQPKSVRQLRKIYVRSMQEDPNSFEELERALVRRTKVGTRPITRLKLSGSCEWVEKEPFAHILDSLKQVVGRVSIVENE